MSTDWVTVARFSQVGLADVARTKLESEGVKAFIPTRHLRAVYGGGLPGDYEVQVQKEDEETALKILVGSPEETLSDDRVAFDSESRVCPQCGSKMIELEGGGDSLKAFCRSCQYKWNTRP